MGWIWVQIPIISLTNWVPLSKLLNHSVLHLQNRSNNGTYLIALL